ncbi:Pep3/Vps18/deep orange family-domain-containing protein [Pterulicium gracile]|uniref:Pep3/Vps18/deep orange family-domain-containing protein n=1 Tax=Pterulicium gracile TaxID=1884261 RepID=A0A5C3R2C0_9AGAR|nr:Pep3/Vps18/deep orange family-domain-containing protein [Pterula gracilis]
MFDEFVEHAGATGHIQPGYATQVQTKYEGFEPLAPHQADDLIGEPEGYTSESTDAPIFELERVQYTVPAPLVSLAVSSDLLVMGMLPNEIVMIELTRADQIIRMTIPRNEFTLHKVFVDPSGRHIVVTSTQGENWYLFKGWKKPKLLKSFKMVIESMAWNKTALLSSGGSTSSREILIGARNGTIYEGLLDAEEDFFKSPDRHIQSVYSTQERQPITGIKFDIFPPQQGTKALVIATTPSRIYQFVGSPDRKSEEGGRVFGKLFAKYRDTAPKISELPGSLKHSELHFFTQNADQAQSLPASMAWLTGPGVYHGGLNFNSTSDDLVDGASLLPYPSFESGVSDAPLSISVTQFHFLLLYHDRLIGVGNLDERVAYDERLPLNGKEIVRGMASDPIRKTYWVYTDQSLYELVLRNETRDVWSLYLEQGKYDSALQYARTASQRDHVLSAQASAYFDDGRYFEAAQVYAQCSATFEEVALKFLDKDERDPLRAYLISRLERTRKTDLTQRMMLATWLVEFYLSKCNQLDDLIASESVSQDVENLRTERSLLEDDLKQFFNTYKPNLDPHTTYELIQGHGRTDMYLYYATTVGDLERVIEHWVLEEEWSKALDVISSQTDLEIYYRYGPILLKRSPRETVDAWLRQPSLDPLRLVPSLLQLQHIPRDPLSPNHSVRYLNHIIFKQDNTSPIIHNLLLTFLTSPSHDPSSDSQEDGPLLRFLSTAPADPLTNKPYYDLDYALRLCKQGGRTQACVHIFSKMGLYENSVDLALDKGDLELAKINADMPEDDDQLRKKLWLKIAKYVVQDKKDIKTAMQFLENTDLLSIEDILPFFPDFVVIDDFKEEIAHALENYSSHIEVLKSEMDEATRTADTIRQDIQGLKDRFVTIDAGELCSVCSHLLLTRQFYVFPCHHTFHADCLIGLAKEYLPSHALRRIIALQAELVKGTAGKALPNGAQNKTPVVTSQPIQQRTLLSASFAAPLRDSTRAAGSLGRGLLTAGDKLRDLIVPDALATLVTAPVGWIPGMPGAPGWMTGGGGGGKITEQEVNSKVKQLRTELDEVLSSNCPLCESVVVGLDKPFLQEGEEDISWAL